MLTLHWKAPLQPKGFLKIVELLVAILAFSLVAGYTITSTVTCSNSSRGVEIRSSYPFFTYQRSTILSGTPHVNGTVPFDQHIISGQFFVAWGVLSMLYCIVAVAVYILFTANENLEKVVDMLIYTDLAFHVVWVLGWFIACIDWAVGFNRLRSLVNNLLTDAGNTCEASIDPNTPPFVRNPDTFVQASIADVFGFLSLFLWAVNIYWVLIDTSWFIQWKARRASGQY